MDTYPCLVMVATNVRAQASVLVAIALGTFIVTIMIEVDSVTIILLPSSSFEEVIVKGVHSKLSRLAAMSL